MENLELCISVLEKEDVQEFDDTFRLSDRAAAAAKPEENVLVVGVTLEGACWDKQNECLALSDNLTSSLPSLVLTWKNRETTDIDSDPQLETIPIYLNETRLDHVFSVKMRLPNDIPRPIFYQRATALTIWSPPV